MSETPRDVSTLPSSTDSPTFVDVEQTDQQCPPVTPDSAPSSRSPSFHEPSDFPQSCSATPLVRKRRIYLMVSGEAGLIFSWVLRFALTTPYFEQALEAGTVISHSVWILGPLSGLITAPLVGVLSDRCLSPLGRRRPYILGGLIASLISMNIFARARELLAFVGLHNHWYAVTLGVLSFGVMDFAANVIMFPSRALLGDLVPAEQQHDVQSAAAVVASVTEIFASIYLFSMDQPVTHIRDAFWLASIVMILTVSITLFVCKEKSAVSSSPRDSFGRASPPVELEDLELETDEKDVEEQRQADGALPNGNHETEGLRSSESAAEEAMQEGPREASTLEALYDLLYSALTTFPKELNRVGLVYGFAWLCWYACLPYFSVWIGRDVLGGDPEAPEGSVQAAAYQRGVNVFSVANVFKALVALAFSAMYPAMLKFIGEVGERLVFGGSFAIFFPVLFLASGTKSAFLAAVAITLGAIPFIATQTIPVAIVVQRFPRHLASNLGVLNLFCVVPQLIDTIYTGWLAKVASEATVLRVAAGWGFCAALAAWLLL